MINNQIIDNIYTYIWIDDSRCQIDNQQVDDRYVNIDKYMIDKIKQGIDCHPQFSTAKIIKLVA